jgi:hypothetical protein
MGQSGNYDELVQQAKALLNDDKLPEAKAEAEAAMKLEPKRYEAFAVATLVAIKQGDNEAARTVVVKALELAPAEKKASLEALQRKLTDLPLDAAKSPEASLARSAQATLTPETRRKLDVLLLIIEDADKAKSPDARQQLLKEFLEKSGSFTQENPAVTNLWILRAAAAVELNMPKVGWQAGKQLKSLGADTSDDPKSRKVIAMLDRKGWFSDVEPPSRPDAEAAKGAIRAGGESASDRAADSALANTKARIDPLIKVLPEQLSKAGTFTDPDSTSMRPRHHGKAQYWTENVSLVDSGRLSFDIRHWEIYDDGPESTPSTTVMTRSFNLKDIAGIEIQDIWKHTYDTSKPGRGLDFYVLLIRLKQKADFKFKASEGEETTGKDDVVEANVQDKDSAESIKSTLLDLAAWFSVTKAP